VHGWACRRADWEGVIGDLGDRRGVAVDLPWHGESTGGRESWDIGTFSEVIAELVHRGERLEAPILVGHSMGVARYASRPPADSAPPSRVSSASTR